MRARQARRARCPAHKGEGKRRRGERDALRVRASAGAEKAMARVRARAVRARASAMPRLRRIARLCSAKGGQRASAFGRAKPNRAVPGRTFFGMCGFFVVAPHTSPPFRSSIKGSAQTPHLKRRTSPHPTRLKRPSRPARTYPLRPSQSFRRPGPPSVRFSTLNRTPPALPSKITATKHLFRAKRQLLSK
ncbi:hypothetical protein SABR111722_13480 [Saccharibacillus brassicae]